MQIGIMLSRALRLRCPRCGQGRLFRGWFTMHVQCETCGLTYQRDAGYFLGSVYFNYGITSILVTVSYLGLVFGIGLPTKPVLLGAFAFCILFPTWFFRYARSLWMGFDQLWDPSPEDE